MSTADYCWPLDLSCCTEFASYDQATQERAAALAGATLHMLTARRVGGCPVQVRPCRTICEGSALSFYGGSWFSPMNWNGTWFNCTCGQQTCGCGALCQLELPQPIGAVTEVRVDGVVLDPSTYRVDDGKWLIRLDDECWPDCQDLSKEPDQPGTFAVTYLRGIPVDSLGEYAAGLLACEFAKACSGGKCRLPSGVTNIVRQGISMTINSGAFPDGLTGIREVDAYVAFYNPQHRTQQTSIWTPDVPLVRTTTVSPGGPLLPVPPTFKVTPYSTEPFVGGLAGLQVEQTDPSLRHATDAEIASIDWGDGAVQTAPYTRPGPGQTLVTHQYQSSGDKVWTVTFTDPQVPPVTGTFTVRYSYYLHVSPAGGEVVVGETFGISPWDAFAAVQLPTNEHFASIEWGDGTVEHNPFILDAEGFATHVYEAAGSPRADVTFLDGTVLRYTVTVAPSLVPTYTVTEQYQYPVVDYEDSAGLLIEQVTPTPGQATDAEIASITWEPGVVQTAPFVRDVLGRILHTYTSFGDKNWQVDFANGATPITGSVHATYYYYVGWLPSNGRILVGGSIAIRPLDNWQGNPLPPDEHFAAVDWQDGSPIQHPPFTVDVDGYATHVYNAVGVYNIQIGFIDTLITSLGITVTATQEDLDALADQPPPVLSKPPPEGVE